MILDRPNPIGGVCTNCFGPVQFFFGQVQIMKISPEMFNLSLTKMTWT